MRTISAVPPVARLIAGAAALAALATLVVTRDSWAHGALKSSVPAAGAHLDRVPREVRLTFNEKAEKAFTRVALVAADGRSIAMGPVTILPDSPTVALAAITDALAPGVYTVNWQFGGSDGHPVRGSFKFTVAPGALVDTPAVAASSTQPAADTAAPHHPPTSIPDHPDPQAFDAGSPLFAVVRWLTFLGALGVVGAVAFRYAVAGRMSAAGSATGLALVEPSLSRAAALGLAAATLLLVASLLRLYAQSVAMHGVGSAMDAGVVGSMIVGTLWGKAWLLQVASAIAAAVGFQVIRRGRFGAWSLVGVSALAIALSLSLSGHAPASPRWPALAVAADTLHVVGAAGWLGSLLFVLAAGIGAAVQLPPTERGGAVADLVNSFSPTALVFAGVAGLTGLFAAWLHLQQLSALWTSDYGRTLMLKLAVLSLVAGTGAYNWLRVRPTLGDERGTVRIRRSASVELTVAAVVLAITAVLVASPTPASPMP